MKTTELVFDGAIELPYKLHAVIWEPNDGKAEAVVQITHGMTEHIGRYKNLAKQLTQHGVAIAGFDLRGHGQNEGDSKCASFGEGGWKSTLQDMHIYREIIKERFPNARYYMLGFSLGTFLVCDYVNEFPEEKMDGIILMGMGYQNAGVLSAVIRMMQKEAAKIGWNCSSPFVKKLSFGVYNDRFKPTRTYIDWLCSDEKEVDKYVDDKLCRDCISAGLFVDLLSAIKRSSNKNTYVNWEKELPVLIVSGSEDPLGNKGKGVVVLKKKMIQSGLENVQMEIIEEARHDVLHEYNNGASKKAKMIIEQWILHK